MPTKRAATVFFVGAGPGDPKAITLRGIECLNRADVVLYDYLVNDALLAHAPTYAIKKCLGKAAVGRTVSVSEIMKMTLNAALAGKTVVRLKSGDPMIFARATEELSALQEAAIPYEIVPGVTAAIAAGSYAGIPLTARDSASSVTFVTGKLQSSVSTPGAKPNYRALAQLNGTLVIYMGVSTVSEWSQALLKEGMAPETPVAVIRRCSFSDQEQYETSLGDVAALVERVSLQPPALFVIGSAVLHLEKLAWREDLPLYGITVLNTRPAAQQAELSRLLSERGARVLYQPALTISPVNDSLEFDSTIQELSSYDWGVFTSANAVQFFFQRLNELGFDNRKFGKAKIASVGPATSAVLQKQGIRTDLQSKEPNANALGERLSKIVAGKRILFPCGNRRRSDILSILTQSGAEVKEIEVYRSAFNASVDEGIRAQLATGEIDWVVVTSSASAQSIASMFGVALKQTRLAAISQQTADNLTTLGFSADAVASTCTMQSLVEAIARQELNRKKVPSSDSNQS